MHDKLLNSSEREPQDDLVPLLAHILDSEGNWEKLLKDQNEFHLAELLYKFTKNPKHEQLEELIEVIEEREDEDLLSLIDDLDIDWEDMHSSYLEALSHIIEDVESWRPARNASAINVARRIKARGLAGSVHTIQWVIEQFLGDEQAQWSPVTVQARAFHKDTEHRQFKSGGGDNGTLERLSGGDVAARAGEDPAPAQEVQNQYGTLSEPFRNYLSSLDLDDFDTQQRR